MRLIDTLKNHNNVYDTKKKKYGLLSRTTSFVIPMFNSEESIEVCLKSICDQSAYSSIKEIVVVDDASTDKSRSIVNQFIKETGSKKIILLVNQSRRYSAYSRNRGLAVSTADTISFVDSDIIVPQEYVKQHLEIHHNNAPCISFSLRSNIRKSSKISFPIHKINGDFREKILKQSTLQGAPFQFSKTHTLAEISLTCAITYSRADINSVKGAPENFVGWGFNDTALAAKVLALGGRPLIYAESTPVYHLIHKPRSGNSLKKRLEYIKNQQRYKIMLDLSLNEASKYIIPELD